MRTHKLPRLAQGQPVSVALLNRIIDHVNGLEINVSGSLEQVTLPGGTRIIRGLATSGTSLKIGVLVGPLEPRGSGSGSAGSATMRVWEGEPPAEVQTSEELEVWDWLLAATDDPLAAGSHVIAALINGYWYVIAAACTADEVDEETTPASDTTSASFTQQNDSTSQAWIDSSEFGTSLGDIVSAALLQ